MAMLYGWSLDSFHGIDHTYVTSSEGHVWNCWGRSTGGQQICSGVADAGQADCLSQKNSHAGLLYGITGVCHQTANRILYPARCIVSAADNYWLTALLYGTYGLSVVRFKSRLAHCLDGEEYYTPRSKELSGEAAYLQKINLLYANALAKQRQPGLSKDRLVFRLLQNELKITAAYRLGSEARAGTTGVLLKFQSDLLTEKNFYDRALMARRLDPVMYAEKMNEIINNTYKDIKKSLGESRCQKMFGIKREIRLIDPMIMRAFYRNR